MKIMYIFLTIFIFTSTDLFANNFIKTEEFMLETRNLEKASVRIFFKLNKIYGERFRTIGMLSYCGEHNLSNAIRPSIAELISSSSKIIDEMDLNNYGITDMSERVYISLMRMAITATSTYIYAQMEKNIDIEELFLVSNPNINIKNNICTAASVSYRKMLKNK